MHPKLEDILLFLEGIAPAVLAEDWDNPGLQVGDTSQEVRKILASLDPTPEALKEAANRQAQLLLTHHPLIFPSLSCVNRKAYPGDLIYEACGKKISIVAAHTNLDSAEGGINDMLATLLALKDTQVLQRNASHPNAGLGRIGDLPSMETLHGLASRVKNLLGSTTVGACGRPDKPVRRMAVVGGSGGGLVSLASSMGADVLVTGDVRHHDALRAASLGLGLIDAGHYHMERRAFSLFAARLKALLDRKGWRVAVEAFEEETEPLQRV